MYNELKVKIAFPLPTREIYLQKTKSNLTHFYKVVTDPLVTMSYLSCGKLLYVSKQNAKYFLKAKLAWIAIKYNMLSYVCSCVVLPTLLLTSIDLVTTINHTKHYALTTPQICSINTVPSKPVVVNKMRLH